MSKTVKKKNIQKITKYFEFIRWFATPEPYREQKTMGEFAKHIGVAAETLSDWKQADTFWADVEAQLKTWMQDRAPNVIAKLYQQILKDGKAPEVKLFLQYGVGFSEKVQVEDKALARVYNIEKLLRDIANKK